MIRTNFTTTKIKYSKKYLTVFCAIFLSVPGIISYSQSASANSSASAVIAEPICLTNVRDMDFGIIAAGATSGTVILAPAASSVRTTTGGVTLPSGSGTVQSAKFIVSGITNNAYSVVLPSEAITLSNGTNFMTLDNFTSTPSGSGIITSGSQPLYIGATLNVNAFQEAGIYKSTKDFEIIVNYY